jgi:hypothetical protein
MDGTHWMDRVAISISQVKKTSGAYGNSRRLRLRFSISSEETTMFKFIADTPQVSTFTGNSIFVTNALQIIAREHSVEDLLNAPRYVTYKSGDYTFKLEGFTAQNGMVTLCWSMLTSEFGDKIAQVQSIHAGALAVKF